VRRLHKNLLHRDERTWAPAHLAAAPTAPPCSPPCAGRAPNHNEGTFIGAGGAGETARQTIRLLGWPAWKFSMCWTT
jgi:hypothetical protein